MTVTHTDHSRAAVSPAPLIDLVFLSALGLVGLASVWHMYAHPWLLIAGVAAFVSGIALAWWAIKRAWRFWRCALAAVAAYLVVAVLLAVPTVYRDITQAPSLLLGVLTAPVTGWKNVLTLDLPLGTYQATLAPTVLVFLLLPYIALQLAWQSRKWWALAVPVMLLATVYGISFGSSALRGFGGAQSGAWQLAVGLSAFLLALGWLVWRSAALRRRAFRIAERAALGSRGRRAPLSRIITGAAVLAVAVGAGIVSAPAIVGGQPREVLRTSVSPEMLVQQRITPLTMYRDFFTDEWFDTVMLRVNAPDGVHRLTLATLSAFDGAQMHVIPSQRGDAAGEAHFTRVPSTIGASRELVEVAIEVVEYRDIWVPLAGELRSIDFSGEAQSALADGFFYQQQTATGVQLASGGFAPGDTIRESVEVSVGDAASLADFSPARAGSRYDPLIVPESLTDWIEAQGTLQGGAGLAELIDLLRARGMLSHALVVSAETTPAWITDLGDYTFAPSRAGHSTDRIDRLFTELLDREEAAGPGATPEMLVAASGNDEQFAVAAALIADQLGFDTRIAVGFQLIEDADEVAGISACAEGECRGQNLTAWLEVQDASTGQWAAVATTPQHSLELSHDRNQSSDPQHASQVENPSAEVVPPLEANPSEATEQDDEETQAAADLAWLWPAVRIAVISLLALCILLSPFIIILGMKRLRRRTRRTLEYPSDNIAASTLR